MKRCCVAAVVMAAFAFGAAADEPAAGEVVYPLYMVTVAEGTTNYLYDATVDVVAEDGGATQQVSFVSLTETEGALTTGTFQKLGRGFLVSSTNMVTWLGEIWIDEGAILLDWSGELGPKDDTAGAVRVANGASIGLFAHTMKSQSMAIHNTIYLSGRGVNDLGVIFNAANCGGNYMRKAFLGPLEFEGDALFRGWMNDFGCDGEHRLNGHTLTISMSSGCYLTNGGKFRNGHVVFEKGNAVLNEQLWRIHCSKALQIWQELSPPTQWSELYSFASSCESSANSSSIFAEIITISAP